MNAAHRWLCNSAHWRTAVEKRILPWALENLELGPRVLEIGPGPGVTTGYLRPLVPDLTCIEIDEKYASALSQRLASRRLRVLCGDATAMPLPDAHFDTVVCFTMLHHVASAALQDRLLTEACRVLRPGGIFAGVDSISNAAFRLFHLFDTLIPVDPASFSRRLQTAGFQDIRVETAPHSFRFRAKKPL